MLVAFGGIDLTKFLNQPVDQVVIDLIWTFGWIPMVVVMVIGIMQTWVEIQKKYWRAHRPYILLAIDVPRLTEQSPKAVENIFSITVALKAGPTWLETYIMGKCQWRHSFEITSINGYIQFYIWTEERYRDAFEAAIYSQYPDAEIALVGDYVTSVPKTYPNEEYDMWGSEYVLSKPSFYPVRTWVDFEHSASRDDYLKDPLTNLFEGLALMKPGEQMWFQVVTDFAGETNWKAEGDKFINKTYGVSTDKKKGFIEGLSETVTAVPETILSDLLGIDKSAQKSEDKFAEMYKAFKVTEQEREQAKAVVRKISKPGLRCKIRIVYIARKEVFTKVTRKDIVKGTLKQLAHEDWNSFKGSGAPEDDYFWQEWWYSYYQNKVMQGYVERSMTRGAKPSVLNIEELATIWHFPTINVKVPLIKKTFAKRAEPSVMTPFASEAEEMMTAPLMNSPKGEQKFEEDTVDIFSMPLPAPPVVDLGSKVKETKVDDKPISATPVEIAPAIPSVKSPTGGSARNQSSHIPDSVRVLIEPGVEPEDVGIRDENEKQNV